ncbi:hypothetical protein V5735_07710 (plasmid) [Haladaptatus sp. SPP-AMP-3]|uniref:DUF7351 domain-containing protein n=1 Tax=Haladaptatus sp. SPP-AMP-3 TaxID=3121295 RepID=UPI003C2D39C7
MQDEFESAAESSVASTEALTLIGNDVRAGILNALSDARGGEGNPPALSFSELRSRVGTDVDSSRFNYHLQQLVGEFVERRDDGHSQLVETVVEQEGTGYALRPEGTMLTRTIRATTDGDGASLSPTELDTDCYFCGEPVEAMYEHALFKIQCPGCSYLYEYDFTPPGVLHGDDGSTVAQASEYNRSVRLAFARGVCHLCGNAVDTTFVEPSETGYPRPDQRAVCINRSCDRCNHRNYLRLGEALLGNPDLISFCHERGLDVTTTPIWKLEFATTDRHVTVRSTDPWEVALRVTLDGDTLELVVDEELSVVERSVS